MWNTNIMQKRKVRGLFTDENEKLEQLKMEEVKM